MATPTLVQHAAHKSTNPNGPSGNAFVIPLIDPTLAGNCIVLCLSWEHGKTISSITDDQSNTWPSASVSVDSGVGGLISAIYVLKNATTGTRRVTVNLSAGVLRFQAIISEFYNVDQTTPVNGTVGTASARSSNTIAAGSFTPGANNCTVYNYSICNDQDLDAMSAYATLVTPGGSFVLQSVDLSFGFVTQTFDQSTAASVNPSWTITGAASRAFSSVAVALVGASAGTAPDSSIRIKRIQHLMANDVATSFKAQFPSSGNLILVGTSYGATNDCDLTAVSDSQGNTYSDVTPAITNPVQMFKTANTATGAGNNILTLTKNANPLVFCIWDVVNAGSYDHEVDNSGNQSGTGNVTNAVLYTPANTNGLIVSIIQFGTGPPSGSSGDGLHDSVWFTGQDDTSSSFDSGDGYQHYRNSNTTQRSFGYTMANGAGGSSWLAAAWGWGSGGVVDTPITVAVGAIAIAGGTALLNPQFGHPGSDTATVGNWTKSAGGSYYGCVDDPARDDADYVESGSNPSNDPIVVKLAAITDPGTDVGFHLQWAAGATGATGTVVGQLRQSYTNEGSPGTLISAWTHANLPVGSYAEFDDPVTAAEAANITDFTNLYLRFVAS